MKTHNVILFEKIKEAIRKEPLLFNMDAIVEEVQEEHSLASISPTACMACLIGWSVIIQRPVSAIDLAMEGNKIWDGHLQNEAMSYLGITLTECENIEFVEKWPSPFKETYLNAFTASEQVEAACGRIDHFLATVS